MVYLSIFADGILITSAIFRKLTCNIR